MDYIDYMGWIYEGGGFELYQEFYRDVLKLNVIAIPILPSGPQAFGWFKNPIKSLEDLKGMKCRETGIAAEVFTRMGMSVVNMPGGEIMPAADRGVIDCAEWVGGVEDLRFGFHNIWKYHYTPGIHESVTVGELLINGEVWDGLEPDLQEIVKSAATETFIRWWARWQKQNADALKELQEEHGVQVLRTPGRYPDRVPQDLGRDRRRAGCAGSVLQGSARIRSGPTPASWCQRSRSCSCPTPSPPITTGARRTDRRALARTRPAQAAEMMRPASPLPAA